MNFCNFGITWGGAKRVTAVQEMLVENPKFARNFTGMEVEVVMGAMCIIDFLLCCRALVEKFAPLILFCGRRIVCRRCENLFPFLCG